MDVAEGEERETNPEVRKHGTSEDEYCAPTSLTSSLFIKHKYKNIMNHVETLITYLQTHDYSACERHFYIFEDDDAVITPINRGRSPTMRHISRTHHVDLDWWYDRVDLDSMIQIKYVNTTQQQADILTKGSFIRDRWTAEHTSQHHEEHHIYSKQFVTLFCGCESCIFQHEQTFRCFSKRQTETIVNDKNAHMDHHAVFSPDCKVGGDSTREELCQQSPKPIRHCGDWNII